MKRFPWKFISIHTFLSLRISNNTKFVVTSKSIFYTMRNVLEPFPCWLLPTHLLTSKNTTKINDHSYREKVSLKATRLNTVKYISKKLIESIDRKNNIFFRYALKRWFIFEKQLVSLIQRSKTFLQMLFHIKIKSVIQYRLSIVVLICLPSS